MDLSGEIITAFNWVCRQVFLREFFVFEFVWEVCEGGFEILN